MCRTNIHVRFRRHARVTDAVRAGEIVQPVLLGYNGRIAEVLDQFQAVAYRHDLDALDILDVARHFLGIAVMGDHKALRIFGRRLARNHLCAVLFQPFFNLNQPVGHDLVHAKAFFHILLFGQHKPHDIFTRIALAIDRISGRIRSAVFQGLQHRGHLTANVRALALVY